MCRVCVCVCTCARVCTHTHVCQNTDADVRNGMWKLTGALRPEAAFPASRQNVFARSLMAELPF